MRLIIMALRRLVRTPAFSAASILLIGGLCSIPIAVGTAAHAVLWRSNPYDPDGRLAFLYWSNDELAIPDMAVSLVIVDELRNRSDALGQISVTSAPWNAVLSAPAGPVHLTSGIASPETFEVLGIHPQLGRAFSADEGVRGGGEEAVILSHEAWQEHFGQAPSVIGTAATINGLTRTIVGILPPRRSLAPETTQQVDVWFPIGAAESVLGQPAFSSAAYRVFRATATLREDVHLNTLEAELDRLTTSLAADYPETLRGWRLNADPMRDRVIGRVGQPLAALLFGSLLLFAVSTVNLSGLFLQRAFTRQGEVITRVALGAESGQIAQLRLADGVVIGLAAGLLAVALTAIGVRVFDQGALLTLPNHVSLSFGVAHVVAAVLASVLTGVTASVLAGLVADRTIAGRPASSRTFVIGGSTGRLRLGLALQILMTTVLAVGAVSLIRSHQALRGTDTGMATRSLLTARLDIPSNSLDPAEIASRAGRLVDELAGLPEAHDAWIWSPHVPSDARMFTRLVLQEPPAGAGESLPVARLQSPSAGTITQLCIPVIHARDFQTADRSTGRRVALVSRSAARTWWGSEERALGRQIRRTAHDAWSEVIGVTADARFSGRYGPGSTNFMDVFFLFDQEPRSTPVIFVSTDAGGVDATELTRTARLEFPDVPLHDLRRLEDRLREQEQVHRAAATLTGFYALAALVLAIIGLVGTTLLHVARGRIEAAIRQALGASPLRVAVGVMRPSIVAIAAGVGLGLFVATEVMTLVDPEVLTVGARDAASYLIAGLVLVVVGLVGVCVPGLMSVRAPLADVLREN